MIVARKWRGHSGMSGRVQSAYLTHPTYVSIWSSSGGR
jgi:hypothetical protein